MERLIKVMSATCNLHYFLRVVEMSTYLKYEINMNILHALLPFQINLV